MAYTVPEFPLLCGIYTGPWLTRVYRGNQNCNLAIGRRVYQNPLGDDPGQIIGTNCVTLLLPAGTDIRDAACYPTGYSDVIELPVDSGRWYGVACVDDVGKGFPNEHRYALIIKIFQSLNGTEYPGLVWPTPIP